VSAPSTLLDERGCLTADGLRAVREAPPGQVPPDVAQHLAACARCQSRVLAEGLPARTRSTPRPSPAQLGRNIAIVLGVILLSMLALLYLNRAR